MNVNDVFIRISWLTQLSFFLGILPAYHRDEHDIISLSGSEDLSAERDLVEEIQRRTAQFPLTKQVQLMRDPNQPIFDLTRLKFIFQDSYANAIYSAAAQWQQKRLKKQGNGKNSWKLHGRSALEFAFISGFIFVQHLRGF